MYRVDSIELGRLKTTTSLDNGQAHHKEMS